MKKSELIQLIKEVISESDDSYIDLSEFESHIIINIDDIKENMRRYGFELNEISDIRNYYDLANLTGIDSRLLQTVDLSQYSAMAQDLISQYVDEDYDADGEIAGAIGEDDEIFDENIEKGKEETGFEPYSDRELLKKYEYYELRKYELGMQAAKDFHNLRKEMKKRNIKIHENPWESKTMKKSELVQLIKECMSELSEAKTKKTIKEEESKKEFGVKWSEFDSKDRIVKKEKIFDTQAKLDAFKKKLEDKDNFNKFEAWR